MEYSVYVIECNTPNHFYIGLTTNLKLRLHRHRIGNGAMFTKIHGVKQIVSVDSTPGTEIEAKALEKEVTLRFMELYGKNNVRGAAWTQTT